ncbi:hypothetical protein JCM11641_002888 [Rhodosporidiobolus odoratus]
MGFFAKIFENPEERHRRKHAKAKASSTSLYTNTDASSDYPSFGSTVPTSPTLSVASRSSNGIGHPKRSSSPPPPVPPLPGLPSDKFDMQETIVIRHQRPERESPRSKRAEERPSTASSGHGRSSDGHLSPAGFAVTYEGSNVLRTPPAPTSRAQQQRDPMNNYRVVGGLVASVPEERESAHSDDGSSTHRRERELIRDYETSISRQMERLGSASSFGGVSVVGGMSGVKNWGTNGNGHAVPFHNTEEVGEKLKIVIVGSGFAGLATAIACARQGYEVTVVERGSGLSPHGDLITMGSNSTKLLARWGLFPDMWKRSAKGGWWLLKAHSGEMLGGQDLRDFPQVYNAPLMQGHRAQYLGVLGVEARMQMVGFKPNTEVVEYRDAEPDGSGSPSIVTARGEVMSADLIVVCDGVNSYAKAFLAPELGGALGNLRREDGEASPKPVNPETPDEGKQYSVHRAAMMSDRLRANPKTAYFLDGCMRTFVGPDSHMKIAPLDDNRQVSFTYLSRSRYAASTNWRDRRPVKEVTDALEAEGWDESVIEAVKAFRTCLNWAVSEAPPADRWITESGKIALIGDAVHALSPLSFQGGSQAIEDGAALAICLALSGGKPEDIPRATRAFEVMRLPRVKEAQVRGTKQRELWHSYYETQSPASLDLNITEAYHHDAEMYTVASFERTVQQHLEGERDFCVNPKHKKEVLRRLEVNGRAQREAEAEMMDPDSLWERGGNRPDK